MGVRLTRQSVIAIRVVFGGRLSFRILRRRHVWNAVSEQGQIGQKEEADRKRALQPWVQPLMRRHGGKQPSESNCRAVNAREEGIRGRIGRQGKRKSNGFAFPVGKKQSGWKWRRKAAKKIFGSFCFGTGIHHLIRSSLAGTSSARQLYQLSCTGLIKFTCLIKTSSSRRRRRHGPHPRSSWVLGFDSHVSHAAQHAFLCRKTVFTKEIGRCKSLWVLMLLIALSWASSQASGHW